MSRLTFFDKVEEKAIQRAEDMKREAAIHDEVQEVGVRRMEAEDAALNNVDGETFEKFLSDPNRMALSNGLLRELRLTALKILECM